MTFFPFYFVAFFTFIDMPTFYLDTKAALRYFSFVLIMFLFSSHPTPLWFFWISMCGLFLTVCDLLQLLDSIHFSTKAQLAQLPQKMGLNSLQAYGGCAVWGSLHVFVGFIHIPKNMHVLRNILAFATELELEDGNHVVASLHADTACTGLVHNFCLSHVTSYSVFVFASSWRAVQRHRLQLWVWIISLVIFSSSPQLSGWAWWEPLTRYK